MTGSGMWLSCAAVLAQVATGWAFVVPQGIKRLDLEAPRRVSEQSELGASTGCSTSALLATSAVAVALLHRFRRESSAVQMRSGGNGPQRSTRPRNRVERKWWYIEEDRDPTTLPVWQRDYRFGFQVLRRTMQEERKKGRRVFWDVKVASVNEKGSVVEMCNSGLVGWMHRYHEGLGDVRPNVGDILKAECVACPMQRINGEVKNSPWPSIYKRNYKASPQFSHFLWLEQEKRIKKARELEAGMLVKGWVYKHCAKGLMMTLEGEDEAKGMLDMNDISRKKSAHKWVDKMFPLGTELLMYVVHSDHSNGRITLSTKEFEDDDHVGWMLSFPERCMANAKQAVEKYHEKREAYIAWLQR